MSCESGPPFLVIDIRNEFKNLATISKHIRNAKVLLQLNITAVYGHCSYDHFQFKRELQFFLRTFLTMALDCGQFFLTREHFRFVAKRLWNGMR